MKLNTTDTHEPFYLAIIMRLPFAFRAVSALVITLFLISNNVKSQDNEEQSSELKNVAVVLVPYQQILLSSRIDSSVVSIKVKLGGAIFQADELVKLDDTVAVANLTESESLLKTAKGQLAIQDELRENQVFQKRAEAAYDLAGKQWLTAQRFLKDNTISQEEYAEAKKNFIVAETDILLAKTGSTKEFLQAQSSIATAQKAYDIAKYQYDACHILAPCTGHVSQILVEEGESVRPGQPIIEVVDDNKLKARFFLTESNFSKDLIGKEIVFRINEFPLPVKGVISEVGAVIDPASRAFEVRAVIDNAPYQLRSGLSGSVVSISK